MALLECDTCNLNILCPSCEKGEKCTFNFEEYHDCQCVTCRWYAEDHSVCVNDKSDHLADFVMPNDSCQVWEGKADDRP